MSWTPYYMRLTPCRNCGRMISVVDKQCRFCGTKQKQGSSVIGALAVGLVILFGVWYVFNQNTSGSTTAKTVDATVTQHTLTEAEYKAQCEPVDYESVSRQPDDFDGKYIAFHGTVIQVLEGSGNNVNYRINQDNDDDIFSNDTWIAAYTRADGEARVLESDTITVFGQCRGLYTYTSVLGQKITIPRIDIKYIEQDTANSN